MTIVSDVILAGDVGGTKTWLGLCSRSAPRPQLVEAKRYATLEFDGLSPLLDQFLKDTHTEPRRICGAAIGVAGPVVDNRSSLTNVPWHVDGARLGRDLGTGPMLVLNDLVAMAHALPYLGESETTALQAGHPTAGGAKAVLAPGTHLGEASLHRLHDTWVPIASEGGHADFAARTPEEHALVSELRKSIGHVGRGELLSGPGLVRFHRHTHQDARCPAALRPPPDAADIVGAALDHRCAGCARALELFVSALGAAAGDLGLRTMATGGVFLGGGIPAKILPALRTPGFREALRDKGAMQPLAERLPVSVILEPRVGLVGAAVAAAARLQR